MKQIHLVICVSKISTTSFLAWKIKRTWFYFIILNAIDDKIKLDTSMLLIINLFQITWSLQNMIWTNYSRSNLYAWSRWLHGCCQYQVVLKQLKIWVQINFPKLNKVRKITPYLLSFISIIPCYIICHEAILVWDRYSNK